MMPLDHSADRRRARWHALQLLCWLLTVVLLLVAIKRERERADVAVGMATGAILNTDAALALAERCARR